MTDYKLSSEAMVMISGSSAGSQPKYYENGYWYKANRSGYESTSEHLCCVILSCSNVTDYVTYEACTINGRPGCRSKNFLQPDETYISFQRLYDMYTGGDLSDRIRSIRKTADRIRFVKDFVMDYSGVDCTDYLSSVLSLDLLTLNTDRHFNNLGIIVHRQNSLSRPAPVFDNGDALLSDYNRFDASLSVDENMALAYAQPFSSSHAAQAHEAGITLKIDKSLLQPRLQSEPASRAVEVLRKRMDSEDCSALWA